MQLYFRVFEILDIRWATQRRLSPRPNYAMLCSSKSPHDNLDKWQFDHANCCKLYKYKINKYIYVTFKYNILIISCK